MPMTHRSCGPSPSLPAAYCPTRPFPARCLLRAIGQGTAGRVILRLCLLVCLLVPARAGLAQRTVSLTGGALVLRVNSAVAGSEPAIVTDATSQLSWTSNALDVSKITVGTQCPGQSFTLFVRATITSGSATAQPEVTLTHLQTSDFVRGIPTLTANGTATITYRARATVAQGNSAAEGDDVHTITYTILAQ